MVICESYSPSLIRLFFFFFFSFRQRASPLSGVKSHFSSRSSNALSSIPSLPFSNVINRLFAAHNRALGLSVVAERSVTCFRILRSSLRPSPLSFFFSFFFHACGLSRRLPSTSGGFPPLVELLEPQSPDHCPQLTAFPPLSPFPFPS